MKYVIITACVFVLSGCASINRRGSEWPWPMASDVCTSAPCTEKEALKAYSQAHLFCRSVHNYYESGGNIAGVTQLTIGAIGSLAGSVMSPISGGNAAKAWAGLSGATNGLQTSVKDNFSGSISAKRTKEVADATIAGATAFSSAPNSTAQVMAAISMATACSMAPAKADNAAMKALAE